MVSSILGKAPFLSFYCLLGIERLQGLFSSERTLHLYKRPLSTTLDLIFWCPCYRLGCWRTPTASLSHACSLAHPALVHASRQPMPLQGPLGVFITWYLGLGLTLLCSVFVFSLDLICSLSLKVYWDVWSIQAPFAFFLVFVIISFLWKYPFCLSSELWKERLG